MEYEKAEFISYTSTRLDRDRTLHTFHILIDNRTFIIDEIRKEDKVKRTVKAQQCKMEKDKENNLVWTGEYTSKLIVVPFELKDDIVRTLKELIKEKGLKRDVYY